MLFPKITSYIKEAEKHFREIPESRKQTLVKISQYVAGRLDAGLKAQLIYICTHNSRRSHFGQIWAKTAACYYDLKNVETYSGGTEATAFNTNAIEAIKRAGFDVKGDATLKNPIYSVINSKAHTHILCFSKKYNDSTNPQEGFCAVMTCTEADGACPLVEGATVRVSTPYDDPKAFDNTELKDSKYDERCLQIATETLYVFSLVNFFSKNKTYGM